MTPPPQPGDSTEPVLRRFTLRQRVVLWLASWLGYFVIRALCSTMTFDYSVEEGGPDDFYATPIIYSFWHRCVIAASYCFRGRDIQVMTSASFDGEIIARVIQRLGFGAVRGSSSRGGAVALAGMRQQVEAGKTVAFTIDGPRGPIYVAKPGPVALARMTGRPMVAFYVAVDRAWVLNSWDRMVIPKPFSHAHYRVSRMIPVPADMDAEAERARYLGELQAALERVRRYADNEVGCAEGACSL